MRKRRTTTDMISEMTISMSVGMRSVLSEFPITLLDCTSAELLPCMPSPNNHPAANPPDCYQS